MKNTVLSASMAFLIRLNYRGDAAVYGQNCGKGDLTLIVFGAALKVEQNPEKLKKCSTAGSKIGSRDLKSRQNLQKSEKCSTRLPSPKRVVSDCGRISEINVLPVTEVKCSD